MDVHCEGICIVDRGVVEMCCLNPEGRITTRLRVLRQTTAPIFSHKCSAEERGARVQLEKNQFRKNVCTQKCLCSASGTVKRIPQLKEDTV